MNRKDAVDSLNFQLSAYDQKLIELERVIAAERKRVCFEYTETASSFDQPAAERLLTALNPVVDAAQDVHAAIGRVCALPKAP